jgi:hypothetical protein
MGIVGGTLKHFATWDRTDPAQNHTVISEKMLRIAELMSICSDLREAVLRYYLSGVWVSSFIEEKISLNWKVYESLERTQHFRVQSLEAEKSFLPKSDDEIFISSSLSTYFGKNSNVDALLLVTVVDRFIHSKYFENWLALAENDPNRKWISEFLQEFRKCCSSNTASKSSKASSRSDENGSSERTITARVSITCRESSFMSRFPSETTMSNSSTFQRPLAISQTRCINGGRLQSLIMNQLANTKCADIYLLLSNANAMWLRQTLRSLLDVPYAISIASVLPTFHGGVISKSSKKDVGRYFPIVFVNKAYEQMAQFSYSDIQGLSINSLFNSCIAGEDSIELFEESLANMRGLQMHMSMENRTGEIVHTLLATFPVYNPVCGAHTHVIVMHKPIPASDLSFPVEDERETMRQLLCLFSAALV